MKLVTVSEMQQIERESDESGLTYEKMMEYAGLGLANVVNGLSRSVNTLHSVEVNVHQLVRF